jgi:hypothetical protein
MQAIVLTETIRKKVLAAYKLLEQIVVETTYLEVYI